MIRTQTLAARFSALVFALFFAGSAAAQDDVGELPLLLNPGDFGGQCTCSVVEPPPGPFDCGAIVSELRSRARAQRAQMLDNCTSQNMNACAAEQGAAACERVPEQFRSSCNPAVQGRIACAEFSDQITTQCTAAIDQSFERDFTPVVNAQRAECRAQNEEYLAPWNQWCENEARPAACATCDTSAADITDLENQIDASIEWIADMRNLDVLTLDDTDAIADRQAQISVLENQLSQARVNYSAMQSAGYCT